MVQWNNCATVEYRSGGDLFGIDNAPSADLPGTNSLSDLGSTPSDEVGDGGPKSDRALVYQDNGKFTVFKTYVGICLAALLVGCGAPKTRPGATGAASAPQEPPAGIPVYRIDPGQSELRLLVYRAGPMAHFGHNHVIVNRATSGWAVVASGGSSAAFSLSVPVAEFVVDDAQSRAQEGEDFSEEVAEDAKSGTLRNLLSDALLDGNKFPLLTMTSINVRQVAEKPVATVSVHVAGHDATLQVPFTLESSPNRVSGSGTFTLRQSDLGLAPFSVMLGALQVQDELTVKFKVVALKP
jgi:polyisoprenoid-binding protein YceI